MKFIWNVEKEKYEKFVKKHKKSHFLQSYAWGEFSLAIKRYVPHYVGLEDKNGKLVAVSLLLEKRLPLGYSYLYASRGFVIDFDDDELISEFVKYIKVFAKKRKAIFVKIDPDIIINKMDYENKPVELTYDYNKYLDTFKKLGFKHLGFTKNFETIQPRYSFRVDMNQDFNVIEEKISKTTKQRINKAKALNTKISIGNYDDLPIFYSLMEITENKKDFVSHDLEYYRKLFEIYNKDNNINLFLGSINIKEIKETIEKELIIINEEFNELENRESKSKSVNSKINDLIKRKEKLENELIEYTLCQKDYGDEVTLNGHVIIEYADKAWVVYAGNHTILTNTYSNYNVYFEHLKHCYNNGIKMYDQFGTIGDLSKDNPRLGLHEFKKKFGGDYVEFIGEFDLVTNKFMYFIFTKLIPLYRNSVRKISKKQKKSN